MYNIEEVLHFNALHYVAYMQILQGILNVLSSTGISISEFFLAKTFIVFLQTLKNKEVNLEHATKLYHY